MADDITEKLAARLEELERGLKKSRRQFGRTAERSRDHLEREWDALKADISDLLDSDSLADRPEVRAALNQVRDSIHRMSDVAYDTAQEVHRRAREGAPPLDIATLPLDDPQTYALLQSTRTTAVFQLESSGMKELIRQLRLVIGFLLSRR